jgi:hypothetical protein
MNLSEITNKNQIHQIIKAYAIRHRQCQPFTVDELSMHLPNYNRAKLTWDLEDAVIMGYLCKRGEHGYYGKEERSLKEKIMSLFSNDTVTLSPPAIMRLFKVRPDEIENAIAELVTENKLERNPFMGMDYWLKLEAE